MSPVDDEAEFRYHSKQDDRAKPHMPPGLPEEIDKLVAATQNFEATAHRIVAGQVGQRMLVSTSDDGTVVVAYLAVVGKPDARFVAEIAQEVIANLLRDLPPTTR